MCVDNCTYAKLEGRDQLWVSSPIAPYMNFETGPATEPGAQQCS